MSRPRTYTFDHKARDMEALVLFWQGHDTYDIGKRLGVPEYIACRMLGRARALIKAQIEGAA